MKLLLTIICLLLAINIYAGETKNTGEDNVRQVTTGNISEAMPSWASAEGERPSDDNESFEPSYSHTDEPSFGDEGGHHE